nr:MAG TPA: hypothetical protein [Caudoviricetes sp.]
MKISQRIVGDNRLEFYEKGGFLCISLKYHIVTSLELQQM